MSHHYHYYHHYQTTEHTKESWEHIMMTCIALRLEIDFACLLACLSAFLFVYLVSVRLYCWTWVTEFASFLEHLAIHIFYTSLPPLAIALSIGILIRFIYILSNRRIHPRWTYLLAGSAITLRMIYNPPPILPNKQWDSFTIRRQRLIYPWIQKWNDPRLIIIDRRT